jgi:cellulose synthase/poly-beta-1,6-N-acetylglucosamine synthase-like glycosyltransferase
MTSVLIGIHTASVVGLAVYGFLGFFTLWKYWRHRADEFPLPPADTGALPAVTIQLPIYNEREVVRRLIDAVCALEYPPDRLEIQVLDDSTDDTTQMAADAVSFYAAQGVDIVLIHRAARRGFKAGALADGLESARGELLAIFDADFVPEPDFLLRTVPHFMENQSLGAVQVRWGHLNDHSSYLTGAQAIALDKHFAVEQLIRHRADYFPKFNGAAGVWRKSAVVDSEGWQADTVCEDLCLSTRAVLRGWQFYFANDVVAPAELPATILAYKTQQSRWTMGATQCLIKYGWAIWRANDQPLVARLYALLSMSAYLTNAFLLALLLVQLPLLLMGARPPGWLYVFSLLGFGQPLLFVLAQRALYSEWSKRLRYFPALLLIAIGISPSNTYAVIQALSRTEFTFARTPKGSPLSYRLSPTRMLIVEAAFFVYCVLTLILASIVGNSGPVLLLSFGTLGFGYVVLLSIRESHSFQPSPK